MTLRSLLALGITLCLLLTLETATGAARTAQGSNCLQTHTVVAGETLTSIAARYGMSVSELLALNPIADPDLIRTGTSLCVIGLLPTAPPPDTVQSPAAQASGAVEDGIVAVAFVSEFGYSVQPGEDEVVLTARGGQIGKRRLFPIVANGVEIYSDRASLLVAVGSREIVFYLRMERDGTYALIEPSANEGLVDGIHLDDCPRPLAARLGSSAIVSPTAHIDLVRADGTIRGLTIDAVGRRPRAGDDNECGAGLPDLALVRTDKPNAYRLLLADLSNEDANDPAVSSVRNRFVIEVSHVVSDAVPDAGALPVATSLVSQRFVYPLTAQVSPPLGVQAFSTTSEIRLSYQQIPAPLYYGVRLTEEGSYRLVAVGDSSLLTRFQPEGAAAFDLATACAPVASQAFLSTPTHSLDHITVYLESQEGVRYPMPIHAIAFATDVFDADECDIEPVFALRPTDAGDYQLLILLTENQFGPPREFGAVNCSRWRRGTGIRYFLLQRVFGC